jgi:hypothetical protein
LSPPDLHTGTAVAKFHDERDILPAPVSPSPGLEDAAHLVRQHFVADLFHLNDVDGRALWVNPSVPS